MTTEREAKCEVVSDSLILKDPIPSVGPNFYKPFCLGLPDRCPCFIKMAERRKGKSLSLKRPSVTLSDQENSKKANKAVDKPQVMSSNQKNGDKSIEDNRQRATFLNHENSKKGDKTDERYFLM